ncbi:MAG: amino acid permease [archaeon]
MAELEKTLSYPAILLITINSILGTGIFFLPAVGARYAGPASLISWILLSIVAIYISMCFAELTSMFPESGGIYEFCKQAYGRFASFIIGWTTILTSNITIAMLVVGAIQYLVPVGSVWVKLCICLFFILIFNLIAYSGMETSATMLVAFAIITTATLVSLIVPGFGRMELSNFSPFFVFPISSVMLTIFFIAETFFGWETATFLAAETKDGKRVMPKALITATVVIAIICILFVFTSLGVAPWKEFGDSKAPLSYLGTLHFGEFGGTVFTLMVYMAIIGSVAGWVVSAPRLLLAMAKDKLLLSHMARIHPTRKTPHVAIFFQTILSIIFVLAGFGAYEQLLHLLIPLVLFLYSAVILSLVVLRKTKPEMPRYYRAPFGKFGPFITIGFFAFLILMWLRESSGAWHTLKLGFSFISVGLPLYFLVSIYYDPKMITEVRDITAYFTRFTERITIPRKVRDKILAYLGDTRGKIILEYGCSVGTLTVGFARSVGPSGRVFAVDISRNELRIAEKRIERDIWQTHERIHGRVHVIHDKDQIVRVPPGIPYADIIVSIGTLGYLQDVKTVLKGMQKIMPAMGKICFVEYGDFFRLIPNVEWLGSNDTIEKIFRECGFSVQVVREKGIFWNYIYVYGIRSDRDVAYI